MQHNKIITANKVIYHEEIFPELNLKLGTVTNFHEQLIQVLDLIDVESVYPKRTWNGGFGRPPLNHQAILCAFVAKAMLNLSTNVDLIERLKVDRVLRAICGFDYRSDSIPSESTLSRVFADLSERGAGDKAHALLVTTHCREELYEHSAIDASSIAVAEKVVKNKAENKKNLTTADQHNQTLAEIMHDLPQHCDYGAKRDSNGNQHVWKGYKLHLVVNEYNVPLASVVTSASIHDSLVAIPLVRLTEDRVDVLYYTADKAYDAKSVRDEIRDFGKVDLIDFNRRNNKNDSRQFTSQEKARYSKRTYSESSFAQIKMNYLPRYILVRGIKKVRCLLNLVIAIITAVQIIKYA
jgi:IS5 family transposase